ncbi:MAG TPA: 3-oxoacyl-ACP synthase III [Candidatus Ozemobacteraceae bacterium]|nr:3-oxoacyl-ACP synthase III [Candidatus Ozemobacteraceae bacterium]
MISGNVTIEALEYVLPSQILTSAQIEEEMRGTLNRLKLPRGLLTMLTGIRERRVWPAGELPSDVATKAAMRVISASGIAPESIGCIINTSVCRDYIEPSVACLVHGNLGLPSSCMNFDVSNACLGFSNALHILALMIEARQIRYGLIVDGETSGRVVATTIDRLKHPTATIETFQDEFATLTLGSGAVAMILGHRDESRTNHVINGTVTLSDTRYSRLCVGQPDYMKANTLEIMNQGVRLAHETWELAHSQLHNWNDDTIDRYIPHQVSVKNIQLLCDKLGISPEKQQLNYMTLGNIGPAAIPITLKMADEEGRLRQGAHVALLGIGSGLNCSMTSITW